MKALLIQHVAMEIVKLAMENKDVLHISVRYAAHVDELSVRVLSADTNYLGGKQTLILVDHIYLDENGALRKLKALQGELVTLLESVKQKHREAV